MGGPPGLLVLPQVSASVVERPRLNNLLSKTDSARLTALCAPAGWGKTQAVLAWLRAARIRDAMWLDGLPTTADEVAHAVWRTGASVVVVDAVRPEDAALLLELVAAVAPARVVATLREWPSDFLVRMVSHGRAIQIGTDELALTVDEIAELLEHCGVLPAGARRRAALRLRRLTGGWPALVQLELDALRPSGGASLGARLSGASLAYVATEVVRPLPMPLGEILRALAMTGPVSPRLATAIAGSPDGAALHVLHRDWGLLTMTSDGTAHLLPGLDAAMAELVADSAHLRTVHSRVARWFLAEGQDALAVKHARLSRDTALVCDVLDRAWPHLVVANPVELRRAVVALPDAVRREHHYLTVALALTLPDPVTTDAAHASSSALPRPGGRPDAAVEALATLTELIRDRRPSGPDPDLLERARRIGPILRAAPPELSGAASRALGLFALFLGIGELTVGNVDTAHTWLRTALARADLGAMPCTRAVALSAQALAFALTGDLHRADGSLAAHDRALDVEHAEHAEHVDARADHRFAEIAELARATIALERGDAPTARTALARARQYAREPWLAGLLVHAEVCADLLEGDEAAAREKIASWTDDAAPDSDRADEATTLAGLLIRGQRQVLGLSRPTASADCLDGAGARGEAARLAAAHAALAAGQPQLAKTLASAAVERDRRPGGRLRIDLLMCCAQAALAMHDESGAAAYTERALNRAEIVGARRGLLLVPRPALTRLIDLTEQQTSSSLTRTMCAAVRQARKSAAAPGTARDQFSARERQVLTHLQSGLSLTEIADRLDVSPNTLKSQIRSIYRKLGASSRADAVHLAQGWSRPH